MHTDHWDPFLRACEETETVVCLHNGSSSWTAARSPGAPLELYTSLFSVNAMVAAADWLWARHPDPLPRASASRSPKAASAGCRCSSTASTTCSTTPRSARNGWDDPNLSPDRRAAPQLLVLHDRHPGSTMSLREHIGIDHICIESDYPHADSTWPDTQAARAAGLADVTADEVRKVTWENASKLFRHPVPDELQLPRPEEA